MKNLLNREGMENTAIRKENAMNTQAVLQAVAERDARLQKIMGYRNYDFYNPALFLLGLQDGETISDALLRRGACRINKVKTRSTKYKNCYTELDYQDYEKYFKDENLTLNDRHDNTRLYENPMPMVKIKSRIRASRLILGIEDAYRGIQADHINSNRFDNRKENLRKTTNKQNSNNRSNSKNKFESCAYRKENDYRFGMAILLERDFFKSMSREKADIYNQLLHEHFSPSVYSFAS